MTRYKKIKELIQQKYLGLSKNHQKLAEFFIESFDRIPFLNVKDIAEATDASVASVIRFSQKIGFDGFSSLQEEISKNLQIHLKKNVSFPLLENGNDREDILTSVANQDISNIKRTLESIDSDIFNRFVATIVNSSTVYCMGLGISNLLSNILSYQLNQVGINSYAFMHNQSSFMEKIILLKNKDSIVGFSFPPYSRETINAARYANERGIKVLGITDRNSSPISFYCDAVLPVKSENKLYTNSFSAISVIINAIATKCASMEKSKAKYMINEFKKISKIQKDLID